MKRSLPSPTPQEKSETFYGGRGVLYRYLYYSRIHDLQDLNGRIAKDQGTNGSFTSHRLPAAPKSSSWNPKVEPGTAQNLEVQAWVRGATKLERSWVDVE